ncbi:hypothetical protein F5Y19DRAFT_230916 [Xylariaceae sp. FL1651]|nr:hypothetical protein F5Y19DRAFT_230916 [Xylariaceae sp. FL1651]
MYIPQIHRSHIAFPGPRSEVTGAEQQASFVPFITTYPNNSILDRIRHLFTRGLEALSSTLSPPPPSSSNAFISSTNSSLSKRDGADSVNTTIGVVVGVLLTVFLIGAGYFLYAYRKSVRVRFRKRRHSRRHRHRKVVSGSSKSSRSSAGGAGAGAEGGGEGGGEAAAGGGGGG